MFIKKKKNESKTNKIKNNINKYAHSFRISYNVVINCEIYKDNFLLFD